MVEVDTMVISAPKVSVAEVIATVGQKMEDDWNRIKSHEFTGLFTSIARDESGVNGGNFTISESATRFRITHFQGMQQVRLWQRSRRYENHNLVSDEINDQVKRVWEQPGQALIGAIPFTPESGNRYNYEILEGKLIGNSLVYKIRFTPRSKFEALPTGTVWVDYSNWVIRKLDASMYGPVPHPGFVKDVPFYRMTKMQVGDFWVDAETHTLARMRRVPMVPLPNNVEVKFVATDHVINGAPAVVGAVVDTSEFWLPVEEGKKELGAYWESLDLELDLGPGNGFQLEDGMACGDLDSLAGRGSQELVKMGRGGVWEASFNPVVEPGFNRVQGPLVQVGWDVVQVGPRRPAFSFGVGYGFALGKPVWSVGAEIPLKTRSWGGLDVGGIQYTAFSLKLLAKQAVVPFAGDRRITTYERSLSALLNGRDPNHYFGEKSVAAGLTWRLSRPLALVLVGRYAQQKAVVEKTKWNLARRPLHESGNMQIERLNTGSVDLGFRWSKGPWKIAGKWGISSLSHSTSSNGSSDAGKDRFVTYGELSGEWDYLDPVGNRWILAGNHFAYDDNVPIQMKTWYGDWGSLRGYPAGTLYGEVGQRISFDIRLGFDLWEQLGVPLLDDLGLQPHLFADYARTKSKGKDELETGSQGTRWDVGFGFGKLVGESRKGTPTYIRFHAAVPLGEESEGYPWRVLIGLGN